MGGALTTHGAGGGWGSLRLRWHRSLGCDEGDHVTATPRWQLGLWLVLGTGVACSRDDELVKQADPNVSAPDITLEPWAIDFGAVPLGSSSTRQLTVSNRGDATLVVDRVSPEGTGAFAVADAALPAEIPPGESWAVDLVYTAAGSDVGRVEVGSSDPDSPVVSAELTGEAAYPRLEADPGSLQLGRVVRCGSETDVVELVNVGEADLVVTELSVIGSGWSLESGPSLPLTLPPDDAAPVEVHFSPLADGDSLGTIWVTSNDPRERVDVPLGARGEGYAVDERSETHIQPSGPYDGVDIVFFVDQSASMDDERELLGASFSELVTELDGLGLSWQAGVVSADDGCTNTGIISGGASDATARFVEGLTGDWGWLAESGLAVAAHALEAAGPGGCNEGLLREDALPLVVAVADERDHSDPGWTTQVLAMSEAVPGVVINAVVGPVPDGCETAEPGAGYAEATEWAGGVLESVCDPDWGAVFEDLGSLAADTPTDTFPLEAPPEDGSVEVLVDGEPASDGWTYDAEQQAVVFDEQPEGGAIVEVRYIISSDCE